MRTGGRLVAAALFQRDERFALAVRLHVLSLVEAAGTGDDVPADELLRFWSTYALLGMSGVCPSDPGVAERLDGLLAIVQSGGGLPEEEWALFRTVRLAVAAEQRQVSVVFDLSANLLNSAAPDEQSALCVAAVQDVIAASPSVSPSSLKEWLLRLNSDVRLGGQEERTFAAWAGALSAAFAEGGRHWSLSELEELAQLAEQFAIAGEPTLAGAVRWILARLEIDVLRDFPRALGTAGQIADDAPADHPVVAIASYTTGGGATLHGRLGCGDRLL